MSQIDISQIAEETCELFRPIAEDKNIQIIKHLEKIAIIYADRHFYCYSEGGEMALVDADENS